MYTQSMVQEIPEPASMSLGCAASLPKPLFIQKTILGTVICQTLCQAMMIRNTWMGSSLPGDLG